MLLFRGTDLRKGLSPEELQKVTDNWMAWFKRLTEEGKAVAGNPLEREGKIVSGKDRVVSDGPFAESREVLGGLLIIEARDMSQAIELISNHPGVKMGPWEVRPAADLTPMIEESKRRRATKT